MPIDLVTLCREITPQRTAILFGAGSSVPSGGIVGSALAKQICEKFGLEYDSSLSLAEIGTLAELKVGRRDLISLVQKMYDGLRPTRGLLNLPLYDWKDIFTTNYDDLIEQVYAITRKDLPVYSSNFDFNDDASSSLTSLFKLHGTLQNDRAFGHRSSMVLTTDDYELASEYRELIFDRLLHETSRHNVLVIGHSLADPDLNAILAEAARRKKSAGASGKLYALIYSQDHNRATLLEQRGYSVCFAGLDEFFAALHQEGPAARIVHVDPGDILGHAPHLRASTIDVNHAIDHQAPNVQSVFNGAAATYGDIRGDLAFKRDQAITVENQLVAQDKAVAYILGPAGFGKTSLCRLVLTALARRGFLCWEHMSDYKLDALGWVAIARRCQSEKVKAVLFVDDAHMNIRAMDGIVEAVAAMDNSYFRLLLTSTPAHWHPRSKTPSLYKIGVMHQMHRLSLSEINSLLDLFERKHEIAALVEASFAGFTRQEKLRRLVARCRADMFVCMKNIFSFELLDDIILRDYATIQSDLQDVYRTVAAMEASNIRVHRQLVIRTLGIEAHMVQQVLDRLTGIITESDVDVANGIYAWHGRHQVISEIILKHKYSGQDELYKLYELVVDNINPSYEIERLTVNELCDIQYGIGRLQDRQRQNYLFRKLISVAPSQRPPRHRLIYNLIKSSEFEPAANEIRIYEKELRVDAPIIRYKAMLFVERARMVEGIMAEDRVAILRDAAHLIDRAMERYFADRGLHSIACEIGLEVAKLSGNWEIHDAAVERLRRAEAEYQDPQMTRLLSKVQTRAEDVYDPEE